MQPDERDQLIDGAIVNGLHEVERLEAFKVSMIRHRLVGNVSDERCASLIELVDAKLTVLRTSRSGSNAEPSARRAPP